MIRKFIFLMLSVTLVSVFSLYSKENKKEEWKNRKFTVEELKKYNGLNGMPVHVAVNGIVYDVSKSKYWKTGTHQKLHQAGSDLTYEIKNQAPKFHKNGKILEKFPKVGIYETTNSTNSIVVNERQIKDKNGKEKNTSKENRK